MKGKHEPMPPAYVARIAEMFKALAEPLRLRLMSELFAGEATVGELAAAVGASVANTSKHLHVLHKAEWVTRRKDGTEVRYGLGDSRAEALCTLMCERVRERAVREGELATAMPAPKPRR